MKRLSSIALLGAFLALGVTACDSDTGPVPGVESVEVSPSQVTINVGESVQLSAQVSTTGDASSGVNWTSSNSAVATVSGDGTVTGNSEGTATVTATSVEDGSKQSSASVTVVAPEPTQISISSYEAVASGGAARDDDSTGPTSQPPIASPDSVGMHCCVDQDLDDADWGDDGFGYFYTTLQATYSVDPGDKEIERIVMTLDGEPVAEQVFSAKEAAAMSHRHSEVTLSKNTMDFSGTFDGTVQSPDIPNGDYTLGGTVHFTDGTSKSVSNNREVSVANYQVFWVTQFEGGNTAVNPDDGRRWFGGTPITYAVTLVDHHGIGLSRAFVDDDAGNSWNMGDGTADGEVVLTSSPFRFMIHPDSSGNEMAVDFEPLVGDDTDSESPRDAEGEQYCCDSQQVPWISLGGPTFHQSLPMIFSHDGFDFGEFGEEPEQWLDFQAPTSFGEVVVTDHGGAFRADPDAIDPLGSHWYSSGEFAIDPTPSDGSTCCGVGYDADASVYDVFRPADATPFDEEFLDVDGPGDMALPERVNDMLVDVREICDFLANCTDPDVDTDSLGVDRTTPEFTKDEAVGTDALVLKMVPDDPLYGLLFTTWDPDPDGTPGSIIEPSGIKPWAMDEHINVDFPELTATTLTSADAGDDGSGAPDAFELEVNLDNSDAMTRQDTADVYADVADFLGDMGGTLTTATAIVGDSAAARNVGTLSWGEFTVDGLPPSVTFHDPPPSNITSGQDTVRLTLITEVKDDNGISEIRYLSKDADDNTADACEAADGEQTDVDTPPTPTTLFSAADPTLGNAPTIQTDTTIVQIPNPGTGGETDLCMFIETEDISQDNTGALDPNVSMDNFIRTVIDWTS